MRYLFTLLILSGTLFTAKAQTCVPVDTLADSLLGVFPMPYHAQENPDGGIDLPACLDQPYEFVFTAISGDSFSIGETRVKLDSLVINRPDGVSGLPTGFAYACNPPNCSFPQNSKGCVLIYGEAKSGVVSPGEFQLVLKGRLYANGSPSPVQLSFPNPLLAPGSYTLRVLDSGNSECEGTSINHSPRKLQLRYDPYNRIVWFEANQGATVQYRILNLNGQTLFEGRNPANGQVELSPVLKGAFIVEVLTEWGVGREIIPAF